MVRTWIIFQFVFLWVVINYNMQVDAWDVFSIFHQKKHHQEVCYKHYGCFSSKEPFTNAKNALPDTPKNIGIRFLLYTRKNPTKPIRIKRCGKSIPILETSKNIKIIIHGYNDRGRKNWVKKMTKEILKHENVNVLVVDWKRGAMTLNYLQAVANTRLVGAMAAALIDSLVDKYKVSPSKIHIIGHSLGSHIAGYIGSAVKGISRITGLDPAGPAFEDTVPEVRLDPSDAIFVDVIHTDADTLLNSDLQPGFGTRQEMGTIDFYPNGGVNQPGCADSLQEQFKLFFTGNVDLVENVACNHLRVQSLFTESINTPCSFSSYPCQMEDLEEGGATECQTCGTRGCTRMGYHASNTGNHTGIYRLATESQSPYCIQ